MSNDANFALIDLLFRLADDELMMGHRNSEWTGVAPILEEDIAFSSMAQDELGHAQVYYTILHEQFAQDTPDRLAFLRSAAEFRNAQLTSLPRQDWARSIVRQFLYDAAEHVRLAAYIEHPFEPLAQVARKIVGEEKYHFLHGKMWLVKLGQGTDESNGLMQTALDELWSYALGLFETPQADQPAPFDENSLRQAWLNVVCPLLSEAGLEFPAAESDGQWQTSVEGRATRYAEPTADRIELLDAMQVVYRLDPSADW